MVRTLVNDKLIPNTSRLQDVPSTISLLVRERMIMFRAKEQYRSLTLLKVVGKVYSRRMSNGYCVN
jgi:hypothetical protein